jgi:hypothetical protein
LRIRQRSTPYCDLNIRNLSTSLSDSLDVWIRSDPRVRRSGQKDAQPFQLIKSTLRSRSYCSNLLSKDNYLADFRRVAVGTISPSATAENVTSSTHESTCTSMVPRSCHHVVTPSHVPSCSLFCIHYACLLTHIGEYLGLLCRFYTPPRQLSTTSILLTTFDGIPPADFAHSSTITSRPICSHCRMKDVRQLHLSGNGKDDSLATLDFISEAT